MGRVGCVISLLTSLGASGITLIIGRIYTGGGNFVRLSSETVQGTAPGVRPFVCPWRPLEGRRREGGLLGCCRVETIKPDDLGTLPFKPLPEIT